jgi:murein DD-endopeptidase MepM/ murein hydrolase activator NlpD
VTARAFLVLVLVALAAAGGGLTLLRCEGEPPVVEAREPLVVGRSPRALRLALSDGGTGLRDVRVSVVQGGARTAVAEQAFPGSFARAGSTGTAELEMMIDAKAAGLKEAEAQLEVVARDWSWRRFLGGNESVTTLPLAVDLKPPRVAIENGQTYLQRGGSGLAVYSLSEDTTRDGVDVAGHFHPGFPFPGSDPAARRRLAFFALPYDVAPSPAIRVVAEDAAGNVTQQGWATFFKERTWPDEKLNLPPSFFQNKVAELAEARGIDTADLVAAFQKINSDGRAEDERRVREKLGEPAAEKLWDGAFEQLRNSQVTSHFAERRSYFKDGDRISQATHFGYDLAVTIAAPVTAANAGLVVAAEDLGIYGNCVLVDHGFGVVSLYGHLSRIDVNPGERVAKGQTLGLSGSTGLAGGDHLHFAMLVGDSYVDPVEWWDPKWIREKIDALLGPPPGAAAAETAGPP